MQHKYVFDEQIILKNGYKKFPTKNGMQPNAKSVPFSQEN